VLSIVIDRFACQLTRARMAIDNKADLAPIALASVSTISATAKIEFGAAFRRNKPGAEDPRSGSRTSGGSGGNLTLNVP
jgi:hypothetical protein